MEWIPLEKGTILEIQHLISKPVFVTTDFNNIAARQVILCLFRGTNANGDYLFTNLSDMSKLQSPMAIAIMETPKPYAKLNPFKK